jgi:lysophospholipase L1-like esterase
MRRKLLFAAITWIALLALLELGVRGYEALRASRSRETGATSNRVSTFTPHPFLTYAGNPDYFDHNAQGFRAPKDVRYTADPTRFRIACLGGSSTYDTRTTREESYPRQLELLLRARGFDEVDVINAGLGGYSTPNLIGMLALRVVPLEPRIVLVYSGFNDAWNRILYRGVEDDYTHAMRSWDLCPGPVWRESRLLDRLAAKLGSRSRHNPHVHDVAWVPMSGDAAENWRSSSALPFERNLITLVAIARAHGIRPVLVTQATDFVNHPVERANDVWEQAMHEHTAVLDRVALRAEVDRIDVRTPMSDHGEYFADVLHMTAAGNRERARIIADWLVERGLVPGPGAP